MIINDIFINVNEYQAKNNEKDSTIIFTHGLAEYSKSYIEIAEFFQSKGYNVITYDLRGHGKSYGKRGYVDSYKDYVSDLNELVIYAKKKSKKVYLVGHSMGGIITNIYAATYNNVDGIIISSSPTNYLNSIKSIRFVPKVLINNKKLKTNFDDSKLVANNTYIKDEFDLDYVYLKIATEVLIKGIKRLKKSYYKYTLPALFLYSQKDLLVDYSNGQYIMDHIASKDKQLNVYSNSNHNIFNDIEKHQIYNDMLKWLEDRQ